jgi:hypothetical protein
MTRPTDEPAADPACRYCATTASTCQQYPNGCCPNCSDRTHIDYAAILAGVPRKYLLRELAERDDTPAPTALSMVEALHVAVFGDTWARPESPAQVWAMLLDRVRGLAQGQCGECIRRAEAILPTRRERWSQ